MRLLKFKIRCSWVTSSLTLPVIRISLPGLPPARPGAVFREALGWSCEVSWTAEGKALGEMQLLFLPSVLRGLSGWACSGEWRPLAQPGQVCACTSLLHPAKDAGTSAPQPLQRAPPPAPLQCPLATLPGSRSAALWG